MTLFDHLLAIALVVIGPIRSGTVGLRRLERAPLIALPRVRRSVYRSAIAIQWTLVALVLAVWLLARRPLADLGLTLRPNAGLAGVAIGIAVVVGIIWRQRSRTLADADDLAEVRRRLSKLELLLPHTAMEFAAFARLAITAGVCEELLYRGYLIWYFAHALPWWAAVAVAATAFGLGHAYQGARGVIQTLLVGAFLGAVYSLTASLAAPMLIHMLMDLHTGHLAWRAYEREREDAEYERAALNEVAEGGPLPLGPTPAAPAPLASDARPTGAGHDTPGSDPADEPGDVA